VEDIYSQSIKKPNNDPMPTSSSRSRDFWQFLQSKSAARSRERICHVFTAQALALIANSIHGGSFTEVSVCWKMHHHFGPLNPDRDVPWGEALLHDQEESKNSQFDDEHEIPFPLRCGYCGVCQKRFASSFFPANF